MDVRLDNSVFSADGEKVGTVDKVVVHPDTMEIEAFIVSEGFVFSTDRIIEPVLVDRVDQEGDIHLKITKDREEELPEFVERRFIEPAEGDFARRSRIEWMMLPSASGRVLVGSEPYAPERAPAPDSMFEAASPTPPPIEDENNLPESTVSITEGTDVIDVGGEKIGTVDEVVYGDGRQLEAVVVGSGFIFKKHVWIPADWIESMTRDEIRINRSVEEAERAGAID